MSEETSEQNPIENRYDFAYFFDISDGNPNGDPDAGNLPRLDPETGQGLVTDVCLKRKIRNYVGLTKGEKPPFEIYVKERAVLNNQHLRAYQAIKLVHQKKNLPKDEQKALALTRWMCHNFFDIRTFGAVMTTDVNCGQVRGPVQFGIARSIHPVVSQDHAITRCAVTTQKEAEKQEGGNRTMGRKFTIPYALYRVHGFVSPSLAGKTGFDQTDLELLKSALNMMFENDRSAARANMRPVACVAFKHNCKLGKARADQLFSRVTVIPKAGVLPVASNETGGNAASLRPPRSFADYELNVLSENLPDGVSIERWINWTE